jgi:CheY-like chemotaxis protein
MSNSPRKPTILLIGNAPQLTYLLRRYAEQSDCQMVMRDFVPTIGDTDQYQPSAIIFASIDQLQMDQSFVEAVSTREIPVLVCAAVADEARARELGADGCLLHPLIYDQFCAALSAVCSPTKT